MGAYSPPLVLAFFRRTHNSLVFTFFLSTYNNLDAHCRRRLPFFLSNKYIEIKYYFVFSLLSTSIKMGPIVITSGGGLARRHCVGRGLNTVRITNISGKQYNKQIIPNVNTTTFFLPQERFIKWGQTAIDLTEEVRGEGNGTPNVVWQAMMRMAEYDGVAPYRFEQVPSIASLVRLFKKSQSAMRRNNRRAPFCSGAFVCVCCMSLDL